MNKELMNICEKRPFRIRNADEFSLSDVFTLFVDPQKSLLNPFDYENNIIKGRMGSGKTMFLRANYAYYQYTLIPSLIDKADPIIPVYIKLSDYQNISNPQELYTKIVLRIIKEMISAFNHLKDSQKLVKLHTSFRGLPDRIIESDGRLSDILHIYKALSSEEFTERVGSAFSGNGGINSNIFTLSANVEKNYQAEYKNDTTPSIDHINYIYDELLKKQNGRIIILFDEAGSINKSFFKGNSENQSYFEILMNQLRTLEYIRVKIAIYPQTVSDVLTETRYGDVVPLQENIHNEKGYSSFYKRTKSLIIKYIEKYSQKSIDLNRIFNFKTDPIEQLINASNGNMRRLIQLLDMTMVEVYEEEKDFIDSTIVENALKRNAKSMEELYSEIDRDFLDSVAKACKARAAFNFLFPNNAGSLYKFTGKSSEHNPINILELGTGRRGTLYSFDYAFCVYKGIPTHYIKNTEKIDKSRSLSCGNWISKKTTLSDDLLKIIDVPGKIEGTIEYLVDDKGFIQGSDKKSYYFNNSYVIEQDSKKYIHVGKEVRFYPTILEDAFFAYQIEIP